MEYVHGTLLSEIWPEMSKERRRKVCDQLASAIAKLQELCNVF